MATGLPGDQYSGDKHRAAAAGVL
ncbi:hypothetical protein cypCar_00026646 [Cyprinus carpio]|nr:hypothetical protein cypCar_00026646 [Cyprinus carpio]